MVKLNQKGMTSIELLVCSVIISAIVVSMFDMILNYQNQQQIERIKNEIVSYSNNIQKVIQDDLIKGHLISADNLSADKKSVTLTMNDPSNYQTSLQIKANEGVISYGRLGDVIDYEIPAIADLYLSNDSEINVLPGVNGYIEIKIVLNHPNFEDEEYIFTITCPLNFVY